MNANLNAMSETYFSAVFILVVFAIVATRIDPLIDSKFNDMQIWNFKNFKLFVLNSYIFLKTRIPIWDLVW